MANKEINTNMPTISNLEQEAIELRERLASQVRQQDELDLSNMAEFIPAKKAAAFLGVSPPTLRRLARNGFVKKYTLGKRKTYYKRSELMSAFITK